MKSAYKNRQRSFEIISGSSSSSSSSASLPTQNRHRLSDQFQNNANLKPKMGLFKFLCSVVKWLAIMALIGTAVVVFYTSALVAIPSLWPLLILALLVSVPIVGFFYTAACTAFCIMILFAIFFALFILVVVAGAARAVGAA
ncbi:hypothetical protein B0T14DRAFT_561393 [Immersiella caudata]|uniref:Transmembrane protein n=1 Tax=Immersiella caudata TaxID=314043 RepID=A0AA39XH18_9PEZI|nr:hypothetical protein B0T14DRAFT_561393 [Immersiella caudata]